MKGSAPTSYTIRIVKERIRRAQKNPGGREPTGVYAWSFPGRFDNRAFREPFLEGLVHRFPTNRGDRIKTVERAMYGYRT